MLTFIFLFFLSAPFTATFSATLYRHVSLFSNIQLEIVRSVCRSAHITGAGLCVCARACVCVRRMCYCAFCIFSRTSLCRHILRFIHQMQRCGGYARSSVTKIYCSARSFYASLRVPSIRFAARKRRVCSAASP